MRSKTHEEQLNEGVITYAADLVSAFRIVKILYQDWTKTKAYELGIIDADGNKLRSPANKEERYAYSPFIRLVFRIKRLLGMVPGGKSKLGSIAAAYMLLREGEIDLSTLTQDDLENMFEDTPVNVAGAAASTDAPVGKVVRRAKPAKIKVSEDEYSSLRACVLMYDEWRKKTLSESLREFVEEYPESGVYIYTDEQPPFYLRRSGKLKST